jgi:hypothetical protein
MTNPGTQLFWGHAFRTQIRFQRELDTLRGKVVEGL